FVDPNDVQMHVDTAVIPGRSPGYDQYHVVLLPNGAAGGACLGALQVGGNTIAVAHVCTAANYSDPQYQIRYYKNSIESPRWGCLQLTGNVHEADGTAVYTWSGLSCGAGELSFVAPGFAAEIVTPLLDGGGFNEVWQQPSLAGEAQPS